MTKNVFLQKLHDSLSQLPESEIQKHIQYYDEMISDRTEEDMSEEEAVDSLEDVSVIAQRILQDTSLPVLVKTTVKPQGGWTVTAIVLAIVLSPIWLAIACVGFCVLIAVFATVFSVVVAVVATAGSLLIAGVATLLALLFVPHLGIAIDLAVISAGLMLLGIGMLSIIAVKYVCIAIRWIVRLITRSVKSLFIRKENANDQIY